MNTKVCDAQCNEKQRKLFHLSRYVWMGVLLCLASVNWAWGQTPLDCSRLLGSSQSGQLFSVDVNDASTTFIGDMSGGLASEIEYDIDTDSLYAEEVNGGTGLHRIDPTTGTSQDVVFHPYGALNGMEFVGSDLYATFINFAGEPSSLVKVDVTTGNLTTVGLTGLGPISGLAFNSRTGTMYGVTAGGVPAELVTINLQTGVATVVGSTGLERIGSIEFGPDGKLYGGLTSHAAELPSHLIQIDPETGTTTPVGNTGFSITGLTSCQEPIVIDSYQCHTVKPEEDGQSIEKRTVIVEDQFGIKETKVFMPQFLCNPATTDGSNIINPDAHLVCYQIIHRGRGPKNEDFEVVTEDQFGELVLEVVEPRLLCMPATKALLADDNNED